MNIIVFDERSCLWNGDDEENAIHLEVVKNYVMDNYGYKGYIYLNKIYEALGIVWNPHDTNPVFIKDGEHELSIIFNHGVGGPKWYVYIDHRIKKRES